ncbi:MAG: 50S ribosomal protein L13 [Euryarchaeota archaeon]|nr:50S ribosomal protein L13 [Euryarchaeota archaeon]
MKTQKERGCISLAEVTYVYDASDKVLGRLASHVAKQLLSTAKAGNGARVIIVNAEKAVVSGKKTKVLRDYKSKRELNHPRKGPFFPRMPDKILKRTVRGMLPYQRTSTGRTALKNLRVEIGTPSNLSGDLPDGHEWGESSSFDRGLPNNFVTLGDISKALGADTTRFGGDE